MGLDKYPEGFSTEEKCSLGYVVERSVYRAYVTAACPTASLPHMGADDVYSVPTVLQPSPSTQILRSRKQARFYMHVALKGVKIQPTAESHPSLRC